MDVAGNTRTPSRPSVLGPVVSVGYVGGVLGPVLIGRLDGLIGLTAALAIPAARSTGAGGHLAGKEPHVPG